jgi:hypothetical protein
MNKSEGDADRRKYDVQLHHEQFGQLGVGKLHFGGNRWAQVSFSGVQSAEGIFGVDKDAARFVGQGYFECGDERLNVHHMWVIKRSERHT